ncbi:MAG TPA: N-6 DNA methylase [Paludibacter sp.]|nr:N-6 DNA methylase [Paludibacter sp.]
MTKKQVFEIFNIEDTNDLSNAVMNVLFSEKRDEIYNALLEANNHDMSHDWFQLIYEDELAQRGQNKQDFTPNQVGVILSKLSGNDKGKIYEPTAGNGSLLIADWWQRCLNSDFPLMHFPSDHQIECWELSNRAIPILLLNLSIRGIMGVVYHGDVLEQTIKAKYILLNRNNDTLSFSEIIKDKDNNLKITEL